MSYRDACIDFVETINHTDHSLGPEHASVVLVEYGDFECPNCKQAAPAVGIVLQRFEEQVRFVYSRWVMTLPRPKLAVRSGNCPSPSSN